MLTTDDTDTAYDIYERSGATITRVSTGPTGGNGDLDVFFDAGSADGTRVFFDTIESLVAGDTDSGGGHLRALGRHHDAGVDRAERRQRRRSSSRSAASTATPGRPVLHAPPSRSSPATPTASRTSTSAIHRRHHDADLDRPERRQRSEPRLLRRRRGHRAEPAGLLHDRRAADQRADTDATIDIYERLRGATTLISEGHNGTDEDINPMYRGTLGRRHQGRLRDRGAAARRRHRRRAGRLRGDAGDARRLPAAQGRDAAAPVAGTGVRAVRDAEPRARAPPVLPVVQPAGADVAAADDRDARRQRPGRATRTTRYVAFRTLGAAGGVDDSDVRDHHALNDVRNTTDLTDYTGELQAVGDAQDHRQGPGQRAPVDAHAASAQGDDPVHADGRARRSARLAR